MTKAVEKISAENNSVDSVSTEGVAKERTRKKEVAAKETKEDFVETKKIIPKDVDPSQYVVVRNGFQGTLTYKSPRTGERFVWDEFGAEQEMELRELRNAKNSSKKLFINNWFMFDEDWIVEYLGVKQYYKNAIAIDHFDDIFTKKPAELRKTIEGLSAGQKKSVAYRAKELIAEKKIDSLSAISALEESLGIELIEK